MAEFYDLGIRPDDLQGFRSFNQPDNPTIRSLVAWAEAGDVLFPVPTTIDPLVYLTNKVEPWSDDETIRTTATGAFKSNAISQVRATRNPALAIFQGVYYWRSFETPMFRGHAASRPLRDGRPNTEPPVGVEFFVSRALHHHVLFSEDDHPGEPQATILRLPGESFTFVHEGYAAYSGEVIEAIGSIGVRAADLGEEALNSFRDPLSDSSIRETYRTRNIRLPEIKAIDMGAPDGELLETIGDYSAYDTYRRPYCRMRDEDGQY